MATSDKKNGRREPTLGDLDHLDAPASAPSPREDDGLPRIKADTGSRRPTPPRRSRKRPAHRAPPAWRSWLWPLLAIVVVALLALAWLNQDKLRAMFPRTHLNTMLVHADQALAAGRLEGTNGNSAHELYAKVLREEPDNGHALRGLRKVGKAELARASSAIEAGDYQQAAISVANAKRLLGSGTQVQQVADALQQAKHPTKRVHATIEQARQALEAGHVTGSNGAAALYHQALKVNPDNAVARHGLDQAGDILASRARDAIDRRDFDKAASLVDELGRLLPHDGDLPGLRARLSQARQAVAAGSVESHLKAGKAYLHKGRFTGHGGDNALHEFQIVLKRDPGNAVASAGIRQVAQALVLRANAAIDGGDAKQAKALLDKAARLAPKSPAVAVAAARSRLGEPSQTGIATAGPMAHPALTPLQKVEIEHLITRAESAADAGHIMLPPGASAYDLYRKVLTIDANNAAARQGLDSLTTKVVQLFNQALAGDHLHQAGDYLATLKSLAPGSDQADSLGKQLADAWVDRAQQALAQGNRQAAIQALQTASKLDPGSARAKALRARMGQR
ncbi:MAG TPA: hypothetical protein VFJ15_05985 [Oleiagrimonas sp.]|nr:hypothetical protein [Oleiagrimonas sp.]